MASRVTADPAGLAARVATAAALVVAALPGVISRPIWLAGVLGISGLVVATGLGDQGVGGRWPRGYVIVVGLVFALMLRTGVASSFVVVPFIVAAGLFSQVSEEKLPLTSRRASVAGGVAVAALLIAAVLAGLSYDTAKDGRGGGDGAPKAGDPTQVDRAGKGNAVSRFFDDAVRSIKGFLGFGDDAAVVDGSGADGPAAGRPPPPDDGPNWWRIALVALVVLLVIVVVALLVRWWRRRRGSVDLGGSDWAVRRLDRVGAKAARERAVRESPLTYGRDIDRAVADTRVGLAGSLISDTIYDPAAGDSEHEQAVRRVLDDLEATPPPSVRKGRRSKRELRGPRRFWGR